MAKETKKEETKETASVADLIAKAYALSKDIRALKLEGPHLDSANAACDRLGQCIVFLERI